MDLLAMHRQNALVVIHMMVKRVIFGHAVLSYMLLQQDYFHGQKEIKLKCFNKSGMENMQFLHLYLILVQI